MNRYPVTAPCKKTFVRAPGGSYSDPECIGICSHHRSANMLAAVFIPGPCRLPGTRGFGSSSASILHAPLRERTTMRMLLERSLARRSLCKILERFTPFVTVPTVPQETSPAPRRPRSQRDSQSIRPSSRKREENLRRSIAPRRIACELDEVPRGPEEAPRTYFGSGVPQGSSPIGPPSRRYRSGSSRNFSLQAGL